MSLGKIYQFTVWRLSNMFKEPREGSRIHPIVSILDEIAVLKNLNQCLEDKLLKLEQRIKVLEAKK